MAASASCRRRAREGPAVSARCACCCCERAGEVLLEKRPAPASGADCGACPRSTLATDVARLCRRAFGADVSLGAELAPIEHGFTHFRLTMHPRRVAVRHWPPRAESPGLLWLTRDDALGAALPAPIRKLIASL